MSDDPYTERRKLTFEQTEGVSPLPTQLATKEVSEEVRTILWQVIHGELENAIVHSTMGGSAWLASPWNFILRDCHVFHEHLLVDEYNNSANFQVRKLKNIISLSEYYCVLGFVQFVLRHPG